jgi:hypothetical protein
LYAANVYFVRAQAGWVLVDAAWTWETWLASSDMATGSTAL